MDERPEKERQRPPVHKHVPGSLGEANQRHARETTSYDDPLDPQQTHKWLGTPLTYDGTLKPPLPASKLEITAAVIGTLCLILLVVFTLYMGIAGLDRGTHKGAWGRADGDGSVCSDEEEVELGDRSFSFQGLRDEAQPLKQDIESRTDQFLHHVRRRSAEATDGYARDERRVLNIAVPKKITDEGHGSVSSAAEAYDGDRGPRRRSGTNTAWHRDEPQGKDRRQSSFVAQDKLRGFQGGSVDVETQPL
ncbi:hypothetical protein BJ170DRAFT_640887 [Xylariales sp. AK1849]|nr:hypothetical protein BJ170DRAFT_640887 [Xylariales sp. AK1849]